MSIKELAGKIRKEKIDIDNEESVWNFLMENHGPFEQEQPGNVNPMEELFIDVMQEIHKERP
jgi:hypothetical protein